MSKKSVRATERGQGGWVRLRGKVTSEKRELSPPVGRKAPCGRALQWDPGSAWRRKPEMEMGEGKIMPACVLLCWDSCDRSPHTGQLTTTEIYFLTLLEARSSKSKCRQGCDRLGGSRREHCPSLSGFWRREPSSWAHGSVSAPPRSLPPWVCPRRLLLL